MAESQSESEQVNENDVIKVMIATDNHLGYGEKDPVRGDDSFIAFEEILELAVEHNVDFILLGGDLFHDATPSQNALHKCLKSLRRHTLGDKPIALEFLSDQSLNFMDALNQTVNYEDPNLNVSIPVFSIHGNHDDPSGFGRLSTLDLLSTSGLVNYFGKWSDLTKIEVNPILLRKGVTQLSLYGLSHIHDARLARLFRDSKVIMEKPDESTGEWFNLMVLHQNRADRGPKNYLPEKILPKFLDLVIWGHEHDCRIVPEENFERNFFVSQPGSSVATSLAEGEALDKHCGILSVYQTKFKLDAIPLKTVRPFIFESINLTDYVDEYALDEGDASTKVTELAKQKVEEMIERAKEKLTGHPNQPTLPLIRLRIIYFEEQQMFNHIRFGQQYNEKVANPQDMIHFKKQVKKLKQETKEFDKSAMNDVFNNHDAEDQTRVEDLVDRYFEEVDDSKKLQLMSSKVLGEMCLRLVDRNDVNAAECIVEFYKQKATEFLLEKHPNEDELTSAIKDFQDKSSNTYDQVLKMLDERGGKRPNIDDIDFLINNVPDKEPPKRGAAGRAKAAANADTTMNATKTRGRGAGRARGRGRGATAAASVKPELDVSTANKSSSRQSTLFDTFSQRAGATSTQRVIRKPKVVYEISDSDSD